MNKENRQSHQRTQDVRWKPNVGENHLLQYVSIFFQFRNSFTMILYWCSPLPVRRLQPAESYNSLSFSSLSWKGATTPYFFSFKDHFSLIFRLDPRTSKTHQLHLHHQSLISPNPTRIQICKYFLITLQLLHQTYPDHNMC